MNPSIPLAVPLNPMVDESTTGWLYRLAHGNAVHIDDFKKEKVGCTQLYHHLIEYKSSYLQCKNEMDQEAFDIFSRCDCDLEIRFSGRYCPVCFLEDATPYFRSLWSRSWVTHCLKHNTPLINSCRCCNSPSFQWIDDWNSAWAVCPSCATEAQGLSKDTANANFFRLARPIIDDLLAIFERPELKNSAIYHACYRYCNRAHRNSYFENYRVALKLIEMKASLARIERSDIVQIEVLSEILSDSAITIADFICCSNSQDSNSFLFEKSDMAYVLAYKIYTHFDVEQVINELECRTINRKRKIHLRNSGYSEKILTTMGYDKY